MNRVKRVKKLARHEEKAVIARILWLSVVSLILIFVIFTSGVSFLGKFADLLGSIFDNDEAVSTDENNAPPPPILDPLPSATNEERISLTGFSSSSSKVQVFLDSKLVDETEVVNGRFEFSSFLLSDGLNEIELKAFGRNDSSSDTSRIVSIKFDDEKPAVEIESPVNNQSFSGNNRVKVSGNTEVESQVLANGFLANVDSEGKFEVTIPLVEGENKIEVVATDEAGNSTTEEIKVNFKK